MNILADKQRVQYEKSSSDEETNSIRTSIDIIKNDENKVQPTLEFEYLNKNTFNKIFIGRKKKLQILCMMILLYLRIGKNRGIKLVKKREM
jgi:hypothetical protein